jgi:hypothetical protein
LGWRWPWRVVVTGVASGSCADGVWVVVGGVYNSILAASFPFPSFCLIYYNCIRYLRSRPKVKVSLSQAVQSGLTSLFATWKEVSVDFPHVKRYLIGVMFTEAALNAFAPIASVRIRQR